MEGKGLSSLLTKSPKRKATPQYLLAAASYTE